MPEIAALYLWGSGECDQLPESEVKILLAPKEFASDMVKVVCGSQHSICLRKDNTVVTWGNNDGGALGRPPLVPHNIPAAVTLPDGLKVVDVQAGDSHSMALLEDGSVWQWGSFRDSNGKVSFVRTLGGIKNANGVMERPAAVEFNKDTRVVRIHSGANHCVALAVVGGKKVVLTWGNNEFGQCDGVVTLPVHRSQQDEDMSPNVLETKE